MTSRSIVVKDFRSGIDLSRGLYPNDPTALRMADNVLLTPGRKLRSRPPRRRLDVVLDPACAGLTHVGCGLMTIAPRGVPIAHVGPDAGLITTLRFDQPDYATGWALRGVLTYRNRVLAVIAHTYPIPSGEVVLYHVLDPADPDGNARTKPSYIEDPWCPTNWNADGTRPVHIFGKGIIGAAVPDFSPALVVAAEKVYSSRPTGDVAFAGASSAEQPLGERVWNPLKVEDLRDAGEWWYFQIPDDGTDLFHFHVSERHDRLDDDRAWSAYLLEWLDDTGTWQRFKETPYSPSDPMTYAPLPTDHRWGANHNEVCLAVRFPGPAGTWIRWRAMVGGPPLSVLEGGDFTKDAVPGQETFSGDGSTTEFTTSVFYRHDTLNDFANDWAVRLERTDGGGTEVVPLIYGDGLHFTHVGIDFASPAWAATTVKGSGDWVAPTTANGYVYLCTNPGTTGAVEPTWPTANLATVTDGSVIWTAYSVQTDNRVAKIVFSKFRDTIRTQCDGVVESSYRTNLRWETVGLVPQFAPVVALGPTESTVVPDTDYELTNDDGYLRITWVDNLPAQGTEWTIKFAPAAGDDVVAECTQRHFNSGTYLFDGQVWPFQAINLNGLPNDSTVLAGIPHWPVVVGQETVNIFDTAGSHTFTVPAGVTQITVELWGAGGGGGGSWNHQTIWRRDTASGGGGGGGAHATEVIPVTPGETLDIVVGAGGVGGDSHQDEFGGFNCGTTSPGGDGGITRLLRGVTVLAEVGGGAGGQPGAPNGILVPIPGAGGAGGTPVPPTTGTDGADGATGAVDTKLFSWPETPVAGGAGGNSGGGDFYGRGGDGARGRYEGDTEFICPGIPGGDDGSDGRCRIVHGGASNPWFVVDSPSSIPLDGWQRYHFHIRQRLTTDAMGEIVGNEPYFYGGEAGKESVFFLEKTAQYERDAGYLDAGYLGSGAKTEACGSIIALSAIQNRLAIHFANSTQLWAVATDPQQNAYLDDLPFGSRGPTASLFGGVMVLCQDAYRYMDLGGLNYDSLKENHFGRPIETLRFDSILACRFWPAIGSYVGIVTLDGQRRLVFFSLYRDSKVAGWTLGSVRDLEIPVIDSMIDVSDRLYWRDGNLVRYLDASLQVGSGEWADDVDVDSWETARTEEDDPAAREAIRLEDFKYRSRVRFHHNDLGSPALMKRWLWASFEQLGKCQLWLRNSPADTAKLIRGPTTQGETLTGRRHLLHMLSEGLTLEVDSKDLAGWELDQIVIGLVASRR